MDTIQRAGNFQPGEKFFKKEKGPRAPFRKRGSPAWYGLNELTGRHEGIAGMAIT